jgi:hypothetical protein
MSLFLEGVGRRGGLFVVCACEDKEGIKLVGKKSHLGREYGYLDMRKKI